MLQLDVGVELNGRYASEYEADIEPQRCRVDGIAAYLSRTSVDRVCSRDHKPIPIAE
jgi:hypothetical protein